MAETIEIPVCGMDCAECAAHVERAIAGLPGVEAVTVLLAAEKAIVRGDPVRVTPEVLRAALEAAGYRVPVAPAPKGRAEAGTAVARRALMLFGLIFGAVLFVVVVGEWSGLLETITARVPFWIGASLVLLAGWPVFAGVIRAALRRQVTAHTLMSLGVLAALVVGEWATAAVVVFFMHVGDGVERFTAEQARRAVRQLETLAPQTARVEREGAEVELPIAAVRPGDVVIVRPGERIPVDGTVIEGQATINQAAVTGEPMPVEAGLGMNVFAATIAEFGSLRVRATRVGEASTFGKVVRLVEEAEARRTDVQRLADRFAAWLLPVVVTLAMLTLLLRRDPLATAAVLVVACSCSFALATPVAVLAAIGGAARRGLLIKGGRYLEALARADVLLVDKTGTLTLGRPRITEVLTLGERSEAEVLALAAGAERYSEHPLAEAVRLAAVERGLTIPAPQRFAARPGQGVYAEVNGIEVAVGNPRLLPPGFSLPPAVEALTTIGRTLFVVTLDGTPAAVLAAADSERPEVARALDEARQAGMREIVILTGDSTPATAALAERLGVAYRAELLPEDKIAIVREYQARGHGVVMVGDGINDAPALAQANVGVALGVAGSDIALEAAHVALMRDDWTLLPEALRLAQRTMRVVRFNLGFTVVYNLVGLSLAAIGLLPPVLAAAAQSLPDLGILANSARLLRTRQPANPSFQTPESQPGTM
ncbi:MAG: heavy metal translocating P-type ATPase [Chloroflexaceae bacterium]